MSSVSTEKHYFCSRAFQRDTREAFAVGPQLLPINFFLIKDIHSWHDDPTDITYESLVAATRRTSILFTGVDLRKGYAEILRRHLSIMGVPQEEQPTILEKLFQVVEVAIPMHRVFVLVADVTVRLLGSFDDLDTIDRLTREHRILHECEFSQEPGIVETYVLSEADYHDIHNRVTWESFRTTSQFIRAFRLQKVRLDSLEEAAIQRKPSFSICRNDFVDESADQLVIRLPCTDLYHVHCISQWLEVKRVCPLCQFLIPEEGD